MERRAFVASGVAAGLALADSARAAQVPAGRRESPTIFDFGAAGDGVTDDSAAFSKALNMAATQGRTVIVPGFTYAIARPIVWDSIGNVGHTWGLQCQGAHLVSRMRKGESVLSLRAKHTVRYLRLTGGLTITGSGADGHGVHFFSAGGNNENLYNATIEGLSVERMGGHGLLFEGNVFESVIVNSFFQDCRKNGATFANSKGGICSAIMTIGCFYNQNGEHGLATINFDGPYGGPTDVRVYGGYCRDNKNYGFSYNNGTGGAALEQVGFENNCRELKPGDPNGAHVYGQSAMHLRNCVGYNQGGGSTYLLRGWFNGLTVLDGCSQDAGGEMEASGKSRLVQVNGDGKGHVLVSRCHGGIDVVGGSACTWAAVNSTGPSPRGELDVRGSTSSA